MKDSRPTPGPFSHFALSLSLSLNTYTLVLTELLSLNTYTFTGPKEKRISYTEFLSNTYPCLSCVPHCASIKIQGNYPFQGEEDHLQGMYYPCIKSSVTTSSKRWESSIITRPNKGHLLVWSCWSRVIGGSRLETDFNFWQFCTKWLLAGLEPALSRMTPETFTIAPKQWPWIQPQYMQSKHKKWKKRVLY